MKRFMILLAVAVLLGGSIGGAFIGGMVIGKDQGKVAATQDLQNRTSQFSSRFGQDSSTGGSTLPQSGFTPPTGGATIIGRGTMGTIEKIEGDIITLKTMKGSSVTVVASETTTVQKMVNGTVTDLKTGDAISVTGETRDDGSVQATNISITPILPSQSQP